MSSSMKRQRGFGLIEVMVTMLVLSVGILAHIGFQRMVFRDTNVAEARNNAVQLAAEKVEDLRAYTQLKSETGKIAYEDIANNAGGRIAQGTLTVGNTLYNRIWKVKNWYYDSPNSAATQTVPSGDPLPDFKQIQVTVQWIDLEGAAQSVDLYTSISGLDPARASRIFH